MATYIRLHRAVSSIKDELFEQLRDAEIHRKREYHSAMKIQSWFRGIKVRAYFKFLHHCATVIQRHYRGHLDRMLYHGKVEEAVSVMRERYYNDMATKIQKVWRGFYVREYIHNYHSRKRYLEGLKTKNSIVRKELEVWRISLEREKEIQKQKEEQTSNEAYMKRHHYLISTEQIPGIYNSSFHPHLATKELEIRSAVAGQRCGTHSKNNRPKMLSTSTARSVTVNTLPPIRKSAQGPFRNEDEVLNQRHRPLNPTLRVETSYRSAEDGRAKMKAEEWVSRVIDQPFQPFTHREEPYKPLLHTTSTFGRIPYGSQHFREQEYKKHISQKKFHTVVSPIPVLDQFGKTY